jgi:glycosyltransferase involved in cell wall biosynthesis
LRRFGDAPHLVAARHLEPNYDVATTLRAFTVVRRRFPGARLTVASSGPDETMVRQLAREFGIEDAVRFAGRVDNAHMPALCALTDLMLNSSRADKMPISILEALASGVPVVTTAAGGIPHMVWRKVTALLVPVGDAHALGQQALRVLDEPELAARLRANGVDHARRFAWPAVRLQWLDAYRRVLQLPADVMTKEVGP